MKKVDISNIDINELMSRIPKRRLVLEVGSHFVKMAEFLCSKNHIKLVKGFTVKLPEGIVKKDIIVDTEKLADLLIPIIKERKFSIQELEVVISSKSIITRETTLPKAKRTELDGVVHTNIDDLFPIKTSEYTFGYRILEEVREKGTDMYKVLIVATPTEIIEPYIALAKKLKLKLKLIDFAGNSLYKLAKYELDYRHVEEKNVAVIDIGAKKTDLIIMSNNVLKLNRIVDKGSDTINQIIMKRLDCDYDRAEKLKKEFNSIILEGEIGPEDEGYIVGLCIQEGLRKITAELNKLIEFHNAYNKGKEIEHIYLVGEGSLVYGLNDYITELTGIPSERLRDIKVVELEKQTTKYRRKKMTFENIAGAAIDDGDKFNLLAEDLIEHSSFFEKGPKLYKALGVIAGIFIGLGVIFALTLKLIDNDIKKYNDSTANMTHARELMNDIKDARKELQGINEIVDPINTGAAKYIDNYVALRGAMPDGIKMTSYSINSEGKVSAVFTNTNNSQLVQSWLNTLGKLSFVDKMKKDFTAVDVTDVKGVTSTVFTITADYTVKK